MDTNFQRDIDAVRRIDAVPLILDVVCRLTGMGFAAVARVTEDRWIACSVLDKIQFGLKPGGELKVETTICNEIRASGTAVVIDHVADDGAFCRHPTPAMYGFQSYISMPIRRKDGSFFGTLCAIDPKPARLNNPETIGMFTLFAELIALHLDAGERLATTQAALDDERHIAELREQFIAVLGHDLRNPLASIDAGARLLLRLPQDEKSKDLIGMIQGSIVRMKRLIDNVMDFARGRLGGGLILKRDGAERLAPTLQLVVDELRIVWPDRVIETSWAIADPVSCDTGRIGQLLSNLLGNALTHGDKQAPVRVEATSGSGKFTLAVVNQGPAIPQTLVQDLFKPFSRGGVSGQGLGLGLYIADEIAQAHGGRIEVASTPAETRFTFTMPTG